MPSSGDPAGDGTVAVPQEPGFGFAISKTKLRKYGRRFFKMTPFSLAVNTVRDKGFKIAMELKRKKAKGDSD